MVHTKSQQMQFMQKKLNVTAVASAVLPSSGTGLYKTGEIYDSNEFVTATVGIQKYIINASADIANLIMY